MAMVVRDAWGRPDACLSLAAIESRMQPDREPALARLLRDEVRRLESRLREFRTASPESGSDERSATQRRMTI
jgi:hypothetical protein